MTPSHPGQRESDPRTFEPRDLVAALLAASLAFASPLAIADGAPTAVLSIWLGLRNSAGQVGCMLFASDKGYPKDSTAAMQRKWCSISSSESVCSFDPIPAGTYAVACFHDENKNGKLDTGLFGIPTEGTAASNNAKGFMGPPSYKDAKFSFPGTPLEMRLRMAY
jgi:uncharacterized protein (DUF2141 family)